MKPFQVLPCLFSALAFCGLQYASAQGLPKEQPKMITLVREQVKAGRAADHAKHEAGWPAAYEKAKSPDYYLAMTSITGPAEAWYIIPRESHAAEAEAMKREDKDPALSAELARLSARDAEFINGVTVLQAVARPDLSIGAFPDTSKVRFFQIGIYMVRPGQGEKFDALAKTYGKARLRAASKSSFRVYSVIAGMPTPTYLVISSVEDYAQFDQMMADDFATFTSTTEDEKAEFAKFGDIVAKEEYNRFRVDPVQSYVPRETREKDPDFWMPK
jgi:hypothetical protein